MSENGEIYTTGKNFTLPLAVTGWTNSTSGQLPQCCVVGDILLHIEKIEKKKLLQKEKWTTFKLSVSAASILTVRYQGLTDLLNVEDVLCPKPS